MQDKACFEITVEDAAIEFQYLRDCKDFQLLMNEKCFDWVSEIEGNFSGKIYDASKKMLGNDMIQELRRKYKLRRNQILRVIEIMKYINIKKNDEAFSLFTEDVKARLREANKGGVFPLFEEEDSLCCFRRL